MISVQLQAKHFYFVTNDLMRYAAMEYNSLLKRIGMNCSGVADSDLVAVQTSVDDLVKIFSLVADKPEGQTNRINTEMMTLLEPQITAGVAAGDQEWIGAAQKIDAIRNANWSITDQAIVNGKAFLQS